MTVAGAPPPVLHSAVVMGASTLLSLPQHEQATKLLTIIKRAGDRMNLLIQDLLSISRIESGRLGIEARRTDAAALVDEAVDMLRPLAADTGPGIPAAQLPHIFDRFWQAQHADRRGIGLGLAIAKGIVEAHGEQIWAGGESGQGSTFLFALPIFGAGSPAAPVGAHSGV